jgi:hypothetical protein
MRFLNFAVNENFQGSYDDDAAIDAALKANHQYIKQLLITTGNYSGFFRF